MTTKTTSVDDRTGISNLAVADEGAERTKGDIDWAYTCECRFLLQFDKPVTLAEMRKTPSLQSWSALKRQFQGRSFKLEPSIFFEILKLAGESTSGIPALSAALQRITPKSGA